MRNIHKLYVYGTLRPGNTETVEISGHMHDLGWFPGVKLGTEGCNSWFVAEVVEVASLDTLDRYEGYDPSRPESSLYIRRPYKDGWIYEYNNDMTADSYIPAGDWLAYTKAGAGRSAELVNA